ncbi:LysR family transcriptional regulator [Sinomonas atrocyanea]|uniref:LysR family transcriptional regulator n=1 Tax=Sinomonas atrocyanea TaxID=37927 RepID=UPI00114436A0|nr:LysR family transcriptional regulator [Sinomonas atrocyanea]GEB64587.1 LysR family transcriptional regulator [Sinomonas atrocyanea]GGG63740.1 LysR family transcriptional regulator [Sinomonas atrocyanea]
MADLDLRRLHLLREVGRLGSLTSAAAALSFTTSAVSQQISKLEREMGVALVERHPRGVVLTEAGTALLRYADEIDRTIEAAHAEMGEFAGLRRGQLRLGTFPTVGASLMPDVVLAFRARHPGVAVTVASARRDGLIERLKRRDIELTLLWDYPWERIKDEELAITPLLDDPTVLLVPREHALARGGPVRMGRLRDQEWVVRDEHPVADVLRRVCRGAGFEPRIALAANDYNETQGMVAAGIGIALAPRLALSALRPDVAIVPIEHSPARRILLAQLAGRRLSPAAQQATEVFRSTAERAAQGLLQAAE